MKTKNNLKLLKDLADPLTFGSNLRSIRECDEVTQVAFAARLGISYQHLSDIEHGRKVVSVERAVKWAKLLGYSESQFVRLALQDQLRREGLKYEVTLKRTA